MNARTFGLPRYGIDDNGNECVLVARLGSEQPQGVEECEACGEEIGANEPAYRDVIRNPRGDWYVHASLGECINLNF